MSDPSRPIVVIEDNPQDYFLLCHHIKNTGTSNRIVGFLDGTDAIRHLERVLRGANPEDVPCAIFTDLKIYGASGFEVVRRIRSETALDSVKVVVLSGSADPDDIKRAAELGANEYHMKFPAEAVFERIVRDVTRAAVGRTEVRNS